MTSHPQGVILDLDGTLLTIERRFYKVFNDTAELTGGLRILNRDFPKKFHGNQLYHHPFGPAPENAPLTRHFWNIFLKSYGKKTYSRYSTPIKGARHAIAQIRRNRARIAVVTGRICSAGVVRGELRNIGIDQYVDVIVTKATAPNFANHHRPTSRDAELHEVLRRLRIGVSRCVFVADYVEDVRSAKSLRISTIAVLSGSSSLALLRKENPDHIIESVRDLPDLLESKFGDGCREGSADLRLNRVVHCSREHEALSKTYPEFKLRPRQTFK